MAVYEYECPAHGSFEEQHGMNERPAIACECGLLARRVFTVPQFTEDRTRLFRNPVDGTKFSYALGKEMPDTRRDYERSLQAIGAEPVSRQTMPESWKDNMAYKSHVATGGERDASFEKARHPSAGPGKKTVLSQLKASGVKIV